MRVGAQECILGKILRFLPIARKIEGDPKRFLLVPFNQFLESAAIAFLREADELFISRLRTRASLHAADYSTGDVRRDGGGSRCACNSEHLELPDRSGSPQQARNPLELEKVPSAAGRGPRAGQLASKQTVNGDSAG